MMCPVCKRDLAPTLSICTSCGTMMNDSAREELQPKLALSSELVAPEVRKIAAPPVEIIEPPVPAVKRASVRIETSDLAIKKTSPTLAEFRTNRATLPEWRLQLQNSVRQRTSRIDVAPVDAVSLQPRVQTSGANALKIEYTEEPTPAEPVNLKVANALKRIEESRRTFLPDEKKKVEAKPASSKNFPFNVVSRSDELPAKPTDKTAEPATAVARPKLVSSLRIEKKRFDTNKLVPIPEAAKLASSFDTADDAVDKAKLPLREDWSKRIEIKETKAAIETDHQGLPLIDEVDADEIDDLAPIAMRFNAGLFDLMIGGFPTLILLSPFLFASEGWISLSGFFAFAAVLSVVMFVYLTASISYFDRSFGMKLFSLELVAADGSEHPTLHQAAVNSAVYLLSLAFGGLGFVPMLMNEERRAAHDLVSGTILIREL